MLVSDIMVDGDASMTIKSLNVNATRSVAICVFELLYNLTLRFTPVSRQKMPRNILSSRPQKNLFPDGKSLKNVIGVVLLLVSAL